MTTYRKTWDKDEFAKKAKDRLVAENGNDLETSINRPLTLSLIIL